MNNPNTRCLYTYDYYDFDVFGKVALVLFRVYFHHEIYFTDV